MGTNIYKTKDGKRVPGSTTIIGKNLGWNKDVLIGWYCKEFKAGRDPTEKKEQAASLGTLAHEYITADVYGREPDKELLSSASMEALILGKNALEQYKKIAEELSIQIAHSEKPLVSEQYRYGGTLDLTAIIDRNKYIELVGKRLKDGEKIEDYVSADEEKIHGLGDIKTSRNVYSDHVIQLGSYDNLVIENNITDPSCYFFIHIIKDPLAESDKLIDIIPVPIVKIKKGFEVFKKLVELHYVQKELEL